MPASWWDQHAQVPPFGALTNTAFLFVHCPLRVLSKIDFFYPSSDPSCNREFMELAWPWGEVLHH